MNRTDYHEPPTEPGPSGRPERIAPMTLPDFLLARFAEDEAVARDMWHQERISRRPLLQVLGGGTGIRRLVDPTNILADCEAKRVLVEQAVKYEHEVDQSADLAEVILTALALPYADHPDYREEWRP